MNAIPIYVTCKSVAGAHTNTIEGAWNHAKRFTRPKCPKSVEELQTTLSVYMWRSWRGCTWPGGMFTRLLHEISEIFDP